MKTVWSGVVGIAVLAGVVYMSRMSTDQAAGASSGNSPADNSALATDPSADSPANADVAASTDSPFEVVDDPANPQASDTAPATLDATVQAADTDESLGQGSLAPLPEVSVDAREQVLDAPALDVTPDESLVPDAALDAPGLSTPVDVPESYPVTEAERYFLPPEERRPGNLGGPPPLNFPGGPSDPNRPDATLAPPVAPDQ